MNPEEGKGNLLDRFMPTIKRVRELYRRFRPGEPYRWKTDHYTKRPMAMRKAERRRKNKAARIARRKNRRLK